MSVEVNADEITTLQDERRINRLLAEEPSLRDIAKGRQVVAITLCPSRELLKFKPTPVVPGLFAAEQELYGLLEGAVVSRKQHWRGTLEEIWLVLAGEEDALVIVRSERNGHEKIWLRIFACPRGRMFSDDFHLRLWLAGAPCLSEVAAKAS